MDGSEGNRNKQLISVAEIALAWEMGLEKGFGEYGGLMSIDLTL